MLLVVVTPMKRTPRPEFTFIHEADKVNIDQYINEALHTKLSPLHKAYKRKLHHDQSLPQSMTIASHQANEDKANQEPVETLVIGETRISPNVQNKSKNDAKKAYKKRKKYAKPADAAAESSQPKDTYLTHIKGSLYIRFNPNTVKHLMSPDDYHLIPRFETAAQSGRLLGPGSKDKSGIKLCSRKNSRTHGTKNQPRESKLKIKKSPARFFLEQIREGDKQILQPRKFDRKHRY